MLRSMYSGISGMKNFQTKLDVIGNNIANVNTYGFKKGRVVFKDLINQDIAGASAPNMAANRGGVNPKQVGLGSQLATIDTLHTTGSMQYTGRVLDMAIAGDGYFVVGSQADPSFTRAGNFYLDNAGNLVTGDGLFVLGDTTGATPTPGADYSVMNIPTTATDMSIGKDGTVTYLDAAGTLQTAGQIRIAKFANTGGLQKTGGNLFQVTTNSGAPVYGFANIGGYGAIESSQLEMSNVDLSEEFTEMIVAQRGFQSNTRIITTSDEILQELVNLKR